MICNLSTLNTLSEKVIFQVKSSGFCSVPRCHPFDYDLHVIRVSSFSFAYGPNPAAPPGLNHNFAIWGDSTWKNISHQALQTSLFDPKQNT